MPLWTVFLGAQSAQTIWPPPNREDGHPVKSTEEICTGVLDIGIRVCQCSHQSVPLIRMPFGGHTR
eukprot:7443192-Pyramimonas_sp.AAC.1